MTALASAKNFQRRDMPVEAAAAYERAYEAEREALTLGDYVEAAVLYFVCTDFGYSSSKNLSAPFAGSAYANAKSWLERAVRAFGSHPETEFWRLYVDFAVLGEPAFLDECRKLTEQGRTLTPFFYLYSSTRDEVYSAQAEELYRRTRAGRTAKERYINSILAPLFRKQTRSKCRERWSP
jgi:hypothetical protein